MLVDRDVVIEPDPAAPPFRILVRRGRKRQQRRTVEPLEQGPPRRPQATHHAVVQLLDQRGDRAVQLSQGEEPLVAQ